MPIIVRFHSISAVDTTLVLRQVTYMYKSIQQRGLTAYAVAAAPSGRFITRGALISRLGETFGMGRRLFARNKSTGRCGCFNMRRFLEGGTFCVTPAQQYRASLYIVARTLSVMNICIDQLCEWSPGTEGLRPSSLR